MSSSGTLSLNTHSLGFPSFSLTWKYFTPLLLTIFRMLCTISGLIDTVPIGDVVSSLWVAPFGCVGVSCSSPLGADTFLLGSDWSLTGLVLVDTWSPGFTLVSGTSTSSSNSWAISSTGSTSDVSSLSDDPRSFLGIGMCSCLLRYGFSRLPLMACGSLFPLTS